MKRNTTWLIAAVLLVPLTACATEPPPVQWVRTFPDDTVLMQVKQTRDGGYVLVGLVIHHSGKYGTTVLLLKMDTLGNTQWARSFGCETLSNYSSAVEQTSDGGYIIVSDYMVRVDNVLLDHGQRICIRKTDSLGNLQWESVLRKFVRMNDVHQTADGGYIASGIDRHSFHPYLLKLSSSGDSVWERSYEESFSEDWIHQGWRVRQTRDGGYILVGKVLLKTDSLGNQRWMRRYSDVNMMSSVEQMEDGGYVAAGFGSSPNPNEPHKPINMVLLKTDSLGNLQWKKVFTQGIQSYGMCAIQTSDGGYLVCGFICPSRTSGSRGRLVKTDSQGNITWTSNLPEPRTSVDYCEQTSDGGYILLCPPDIRKLVPKQK